MLERPGEFAEQLQIGGTGDDPAQQRSQARQRHRGIGAGANVAEQMRHQMVQHLATARANGALVQLKAEIGDQRHHPMTIFIAEVGQHRGGVILLQRILPQLAPVLGQLILLRFAFIVADQVVKNTSHRGHMGIERVSQGLPVVHAHSPGEAGAVKLIPRQGLGLFVIDALKQVFQASQKEIGFAQDPVIAFRQQVELGDGGQGRQQGAGLQRRLAPAADQLEHLDDKLDLADATRPQLDIVFQAATPHFPGNHPFHVAQRLDDAEINVATEDERAQHGAQLVGIGIAVIAHDPRLHHRVAFPVAPLLLVIIFQRGKAQHQRAAVAERTQAHIHPVDKAVLGGLIQGLNQPLPQPGEELGVIQLATSAAGGPLLRPGEDQVDV